MQTKINLNNEVLFKIGDIITHKLTSQKMEIWSCSDCNTVFNLYVLDNVGNKIPEKSNCGHRHGELSYREAVCHRKNFIIQ